VNEGDYTTTNGISIPVPLATGLNTLQIEVTAEDGVTLRLYTVQITRPPGFEQWSAATGLTGTTNVGPLDDFDGDGIANVLEYAMGMAGASGGSTGGARHRMAARSMRPASPISRPAPTVRRWSTRVVRQSSSAAKTMHKPA
jgi:hypothetical protein